MTPKKREREYEKRRYEDWQKRLAEKQQKTRRTQRTAAIVGSALLAVAVIGGSFLLFTGGDDDPATTAAPQPTASAAASPTGTPTSSTSATPAAENPCPATDVKAADSPQQFAQAPKPEAAQNKTWAFTMNTSCGAITVELDGKNAPQAVASMLFLGRSGYFNGTPCHRLTTQGIFVLQCGDPTGSGSGGPGYSYGPVENAPADDLYKAGTIAMARQGGKGDSMGSQFFLVYKDSTIPSDAAGGYTVMGRITKGLDVVEKVASGGVGGGASDGPPANAIAITSTSESAS